MTIEENIKEMESVIRDITNPYNDHDIEIEAWTLVEEDGWRKVNTGSWSNYSATMMECSNCKKHVPYHKYQYCPHCGSKNKMEVAE